MRNSLFLAILSVCLCSCFKADYVPQNLTINTLKFCELVNTLPAENRGLSRSIDVKKYDWTSSEIEKFMKDQLSVIGGKPVPYGSIALVEGNLYAPCENNDARFVKVTFEQFERNLNLVK